MEGGSKPTILGVLKNNRLQRLGHSSHMVKIGMNIMVIELKTVDLTPWGLILLSYGRWGVSAYRAA